MSGRPRRTRASSLAAVALVFAGTFEEDVAAVRRVREAGVEVGLLGCVAAGIDEFGDRLGRLADGVVAPAQWCARDHPVEVGPSSPEVARTAVVDRLVASRGVPVLSVVAPPGYGKTMLLAQ